MVVVYVREINSVRKSCKVQHGERCLTPPVGSHLINELAASGTLKERDLLAVL